MTTAEEQKQVADESQKFKADIKAVLEYKIKGAQALAYKANTSS